ncbi:hypothetical protein HYC85_021446 [Camellia sinensis]|uniref:Mitochondrial carrier protein n=1 Tax=Camellia sinensis TaxID=4442 RepID=A0A7J7GHQ4_CAMSI|nr:hypothetical protein HYC85_021446 [Camellia sinensis]
MMEVTKVAPTNRGRGGDDRRSSEKINCDAAAGAAAGAIAATFVCPLDVIKTRLQVHGLPEAHHSGPNGVLHSLWVSERPAPYAWLLVVLISFNISYCDNTVNNSGQLTFGANMIAASGAGAVTAIAANPLWVVKTRLQVGWISLSAVSFKLIEVD